MSRQKIGGGWRGKNRREGSEGDICQLSRGKNSYGRKGKVLKKILVGYTKKGVS
jgi:hypothetical protein